MKHLLSNLADSLANLSAGPDETVKLFVHIPKTAGTSFRIAAESRFGASRVLRDYGEESDATSDAIRTEVYEREEAEGILRAIRKQNAVLVSGHYDVPKYGRLLGLDNTVSIFRDPVTQVISHYRHAVRHYGYARDLMSFVQQQWIRNVQYQKFQTPRRTSQRTN